MNALTFEFSTYIERGNGEIDLEVEYRILPGQKATRFTPAEPEAIEIVRWTAIGADIDLSEREYEQLEEQADTHAVEALADLREDEELSLSSASMRGLAA